MIWSMSSGAWKDTCQVGARRIDKYQIGVAMNP